MAQRAYKVGLVGTGRIGQLHARLLRHQVPGAELEVVQDVVADSAVALGGELGVEVASSVDEVLASEVDLVAICTSTDTHAELSIRAAQAGKHVFCEKPVSLELPAVDAVIAAVDAAGVQLHVGFNRRYDPSHRAVYDHVASGALGRPQLVRITSRDPAPPDLGYLRRSGGIFLDMAIHDFDMARFLVGQEVTQVYATGSVLVDEAIGQAGDVDTTAITLRYDSGALAMIDNCRATTYGYDQRVEVHGSLGMARSENHRRSASVLENGAGATAPPVQHFFLERYLDSYLAQWRAVVACLVEERPMEVDARAARVPVVLGLAAGLSRREGRPVEVGEVDAT